MNSSRQNSLSESNMWQSFYIRVGASFILGFVLASMANYVMPNKDTRECVNVELAQQGSKERHEADDIGGKNHKYKEFASSEKLQDGHSTFENYRFNQTGTSHPDYCCHFNIGFFSMDTVITKGGKKHNLAKFKDENGDDVYQYFESENDCRASDISPKDNTCKLVNRYYLGIYVEKRNGKDVYRNFGFYHTGVCKCL